MCHYAPFVKKKLVLCNISKNKKYISKKEYRFIKSLKWLTQRVVV